MRTNLIQSYLQNNTQAVQQYHADNIKRNFDVHKELSNRTFIKPLPSNGHLVRNSLFDIPSEIFKDIKYSSKAFVHSVKGTANDNELGYLNNLGMKLGGIAIASYLYARIFSAFKNNGVCRFSIIFCSDGHLAKAFTPASCIFNSRL